MFTIIVSRPGYLPEDPPDTTDTLADAIDALVCELGATADSCEVSDCELDAAIEDARHGWVTDERTIVLGGYVHEIRIAE